MNFVSTFQQGKEGKNFGLSTGLPGLDQAINGLQRKTTISIAAGPKVGKTTFCDFAFVLGPYLEAVKKNTLDKVHWIYFSYEIDRVSKEFKFAAFFMFHDHKVFDFNYKGKTYPMNQDYLMGRMTYRGENEVLEPIPVSPEHEELLKKVYRERIIPIFGEYDSRGVQVKRGCLTYLEDPENPTGLFKGLKRYAEANGVFNKEHYNTTNDQGQAIKASRIINYTPNDPEKYTIIITDHIRKLGDERNFSMKQKIDKWLEYSTWLRNMCSFTFIHIVHLNRGLANIERLKYAGEFIYPTGDDIKDFKQGKIVGYLDIFISLIKPYIIPSMQYKLPRSL